MSAAPPIFMGGVLNFTDPLFGWQLYIWSWIALIFFSVIIWVSFRYVSWEKYRPVWGLFEAFKAGSQVAFIFNKGLVCELLSEAQAKCVFKYSEWKYKGLSKIQGLFFNYATVFLPDLPWAKAVVYKFGGRNLDVEISKKMQNYEWEKHSSVTVGGIHGDFILDADDWTIRDSPQHKEVEAQCEKWNDANPTDQIHSYSKYMRYIIDCKLVPPQHVTPFINVPWSRIDAAFPIGIGNSATSGAARQLARELEEQDQNSLSKYYLPMLFGGLGFAALILVARVAMMILK